MKKLMKHYVFTFDTFIAIMLIAIIVVFCSGCSFLQTKPPEFEPPESKIKFMADKFPIEIEVYSLDYYPDAKVLSTDNESYAAFTQKGFHSLLSIRAESEANKDNLLFLKDIYANSLEERNTLLQLARDLEEKSLIYQEKALNADFYLLQQQKYSTVRQWAERGIFSIILIAILL